MGNFEDRGMSIKRNILHYSSPSASFRSGKQVGTQQYSNFPNTEPKSHSELIGVPICEPLWIPYWGYCAPSKVRERTSNSFIRGWKTQYLGRGETPGSLTRPNHPPFDRATQRHTGSPLSSARFAEHALVLLTNRGPYAVRHSFVNLHKI
jgi:hypothetical protein